MNNFYVFHGIDHKVGVTMVAQSIYRRDYSVV